MMQRELIKTDALVRINNLASNQLALTDPMPTEVALRRRSALKRIEQLSGEALVEPVTNPWPTILLAVVLFWVLVLIVWARYHWWPLG